MTDDEFTTLRDKWMLRAETAKEANEDVHITPAEYNELRELDMEWQHRDNLRALSKGWPSFSVAERAIGQLSGVKVVVAWKGHG